MRAHEPAVPAAAADGLDHDAITEVRDYLEWLLRRRGLHVTSQVRSRGQQPGHDTAKGDGDESS